MITTIFQILLAVIKLIETASLAGKSMIERSKTSHAILTLRDYRQKLEAALAARSEAARESESGDGGDNDTSGNRLPNDGYRRD